MDNARQKTDWLFGIPTLVVALECITAQVAPISIWQKAELLGMLVYCLLFIFSIAGLEIKTYSQKTGKVLIKLYDTVSYSDLIATLLCTLVIAVPTWFMVQEFPQMLEQSTDVAFRYKTLHNAVTVVAIRVTIVCLVTLGMLAKAEWVYRKQNVYGEKPKVAVITLIAAVITLAGMIVFMSTKSSPLLVAWNQSLQDYHNTMDTLGDNTETTTTGDATNTPTEDNSGTTSNDVCGTGGIEPDFSTSRENTTAGEINSTTAGDGNDFEGNSTTSVTFSIKQKKIQ